MARTAPALAVAALALALAGCGSPGTGIVAGGRILGHTVTVYSLTRDKSVSPTASDLVDGEKLALSAAGGRAGPLSVNFGALDTGDGSDSSLANAARRAITDPQTIAVVADATPITVPLFNAAGIMQVTPTGDVALANDANANPSGRRTLVAPAADPLPGDFAGRFRSVFGHAPQPSARVGYRAMRSVLHAIARAAPAGNDRTRVITTYLG